MSERYMDPTLQNGGFPQAQGPFYPTPEPDDFSGDDVWKFTYNFGKYAKGKDVRGEVPIPTQARIDAYERDYTRVQVEMGYAAQQEERALRQADEAKAGEGGISLEEAMQYLDNAFKAKTESVDKLRDVLAAFCGGHPTRKQFDLLPENALVAFNNAIRRKLDPNF